MEFLTLYILTTWYFESFKFSFPVWCVRLFHCGLHWHQSINQSDKMVNKTEHPKKLERAHGQLDGLLELGLPSISGMDLVTLD